MTAVSETSSTSSPRESPGRPGGHALETPMPTNSALWRGQFSGTSAPVEVPISTLLGVADSRLTPRTPGFPCTLYLLM